MIFTVKNVFQREVECCLECKDFVFDGNIANVFTSFQVGRKIMIVKKHIDSYEKV